ncbi:hypothetical protein Hypma_002272 [Hypsizygus marmoreus]|uniref:Uncharacterized protein n=1 Tax=Hypsizygus marmoreus TaxID=39966 RepID=A0A369K2S7_HYPMA|nr:hypothetical protein Hypma_002272 [Hypsizygus marmoreus]
MDPLSPDIRKWDAAALSPWASPPSLSSLLARSPPWIYPSASLRSGTARQGAFPSSHAPPLQPPLGVVTSSTSPSSSIDSHHSRSSQQTSPYIYFTTTVSSSRPPSIVTLSPRPPSSSARPRSSVSSRPPSIVPTIDSIVSHIHPSIPSLSRTPSMIVPSMTTDTPCFDASLWSPPQLCTHTPLDAAHASSQSSQASHTSHVSEALTHSSIAAGASDIGVFVQAPSRTSHASSHPSRAADGSDVGVLVQVPSHPSHVSPQNPSAPSSSALNIYGHCHYGGATPVWYFTGFVYGTTALTLGLDLAIWKSVPSMEAECLAARIVGMTSPRGLKTVSFEIVSSEGLRSVLVAPTAFVKMGFRRRAMHILQASFHLWRPLRVSDRPRVQPTPESEASSTRRRGPMVRVTTRSPDDIEMSRRPSDLEPPSSHLLQRLIHPFLSRPPPSDY